MAPLPTISCEKDSRACQLFVESVQDHAIIFFTADAKICGWNPAAERIFGYSSYEIMGRSADLIFTPEDRAQGVPAKELTQARKVGRADDDRWHVRKDGSVFWANGAVSVLRDEQGKLLGFAKVVRDRTNLRMALENLERSQARLLQSNQDLERFASIVSHDLQAPLYKITASIRSLHQEHGRRVGLEGLQALNDIAETTDRMAMMIKGLLSYARLGKMEPEREKVSISKVLEDVRTDLAGLAEKRDAAIRPGPLPEVIGDHVLLYQLFLNLIGNALKHARVQPLLIEVEGKEETHQWHFSVADNGKGIPEGDQSRIFGFFEKGSESPLIGGLGIGLAISKRIVDHHGGRIWVDSKPGKGTTFHFTLMKPAIPEPQPGEGNGKTSRPIQRRENN
jgi:PAS domain S-box-containing protein